MVDPANAPIAPAKAYIPPQRQMTLPLRACGIRFASAFAATANALVPMATWGFLPDADQIHHQRYRELQHRRPPIPEQSPPVRPIRRPKHIGSVPASTATAHRRVFEIAGAIGFGFRKMPATDIDLYRGQDQPRHIECRIARLAHTDKFVLTDTVMDMDIILHLGRGDGRFPNESVALGCLVIVAQKQPGLARAARAAAGSNGIIVARLHPGNRRVPCHSRA